MNAKELAQLDKLKYIIEAGFGGVKTSTNGSKTIRQQYEELLRLREEDEQS